MHSAFPDIIEIIEVSIIEICNTLEKYFQPYVAAYVNMAKKQEALRIARRMIDLGIADKEILDVVSVTPEELAELRNEKNRKDR